LHSVEYGTQRIEFTIKRKATLKNSYIHIDKDGIVVKTDEKTSLQEIKKMVLNKASWIIKKEPLFKKESLKKVMVTGSRALYLGKNYYVTLKREESVQDIVVKFIHSKFIITVPLQYDEISLQNAFELFYKKKAQEKIIPLMQKWAKKMGVSPSHIGFRYAKKRWGSCSSTDRISLNYHLIKMPFSFVEYVVVHELAHIVHPNHSKDFWKLVQDYIPDYREREQRVRVGF